MLQRPLATIQYYVNYLLPFPLASPAPRTALALGACQPDFVSPLPQSEINWPTVVWDLLDKEGIFAKTA